MALSPFRQLKQRLQWQRTPQLGNLTIPPELILMIAERLDIVSLVAFGLTCQTLYHFCLSSRPQNRLNVYEKTCLLELLVVDLSPSQYLCYHNCVVLHHWHHVRPSLLIKGYEKYGSSFDECTMLPSLDKLRFNRAHLVMVRHFRSAPFGTPLGTLFRNSQVQRQNIDKVFHTVTASQARIVDDQLLVRTVCTIHHIKGNASELHEYISRKALRMDICNHVTARQVDERDHHRTRLPELKMSGSHYFAPCDQSVGSCLICMTDYCITIAYKNKEKGWVISLERYVQLEQCKTPRDWTWRTFQMARGLDFSCIKEHRSVAFPEKHGPGIIRHRWRSQDAVMLESKPKGWWVGRSG